MKILTPQLTSINQQQDKAEQKNANRRSGNETQKECNCFYLPESEANLPEIRIKDDCMKIKCLLDSKVSLKAEDVTDEDPQTVIMVRFDHSLSNALLKKINGK